MSRQNFNRKIIRILTECVELWPDLRFQQILQNVGIVKPHEDSFFEESENTFKKLESLKALSKDITMIFENEL